MRSSGLWIGMCVCTLTLCGCNSGSPSAEENPAAGTEVAQAEPGTTAGGAPLPTVSISAGQAPKKELDEYGFEEPEQMADQEQVDILPAEEGTPEWLILEITKLRVDVNPKTVKTEDVEALRSARKERNTKIIDLAARCIQQTHRSENEAEQRLFNVAVRHMLDARLELALQGDRDSIDSLYDDAASLWERDKESQAAAEAALTLVNLAYTNAKSTAPKGDLKWLQEFARQASHYAVNFPKQEGKSVPLLFAAAYSCELHGLTDEAIKAYTLIEEKFPASMQAQRVSGILRRLNLAGEPLQFGGPTLGGGFLYIEQLAGRVVMIVFWSSAAKPTLDALPMLKAAEAKFGKYGFKIVGVCLDEDEEVAKKFLADHEITWPQIFHGEEGKKGWNNPIVNYYGVLEVGLWLVDQNGNTVATSVAATDLNNQIIPLLKRGASREPTSPPR